MGRRLDLVAIEPRLPAICREYLDRERAACGAAVDAGEAGLEVARRLTAALDGLVSSLLPAAVALAGVSRTARAPGRFALAAVGGYARRRMALRSDLDLVFVAERRNDAGVEAVAEAVLYALWDLGIEVGHVVRTIPECLALARDDLKSATALLEMRRIGGDEALVTELVDEAHRAVFGKDVRGFLERLRAERESRHSRFGDSPYLLEPDVKSSRGGLRDLDVAFWAARAALRVTALEDLPPLGLLSHRELADLRAADDLLWRIRQALHRRAGRRADRLGFEEQEELARAFGFEDVTTLGVEQFMQRYYRHARAVARCTDALLDRLAPEPDRRPSLEIEDVEEAPGLVVADGRLAVRDPSVLERAPDLLVGAFRVAAVRALELQPQLADAIARAVHMPHVREALRASPQVREDFRWLLRRGPAGALETMHDLGVLVALLPELHHVTGRVQHDVYHVYTVDVHSLRALARYHALAQGALVDEYPHASHVAGEVTGDDVLALAILLHDVGKARGRDHSAVGAEMMTNVAARLALSPDEAARAVWLVGEHLSMYRVAMKRDVSDPALVADFARSVSTTERLRDLYVLTFADLSTTGPTVMTDWKATMLADLYQRAASLLEHGPGDRREASDARAAVLARAAGDAFVGAFVDSLPDRSFHGHGVDAILRHAETSRARQGAVVKVSAWERAAERATEIVVVCDDRPGTLARIACALAAHRLEVTTAHLHARRGGEVVDALVVRGPVSPAVLARLEADLADLLAGTVAPEALLAKRRPPSGLRSKVVPVMPTRVDVDDGASPTHTVIDVYTHDRPGVLFAIARSIAEAGLTIDRARLNTEGSRVVDAFYVTDAGGGKVTDSDRLAAVRRGIVEALEALGPVRRRS